MLIAQPRSSRVDRRSDIAAIIVEIQSRFDTASRFEERHPAIDIKAQRMRCEAAMFYFENAKAIKAECIARGITLKQMFGCGERHLRKLRQLWRCWTEYRVFARGLCRARIRHQARLSVGRHSG